ncbi:unnamed protein product [Prunus armeniaca]|uniref:Uncharacterized protein n=1 Tax=Prunus armeniaca TaxID=36596 RepID=A0A6J5VPF6_PRUAR|nr:unnamed protein product [Prunus armeniaca]CAB4319962.1 unnamed protein product [Prunus armeniaca]
MDDDELISYVLDGLGLEYKELATTPHLHPDIDFDRFYDLALREEHLQKRMSLNVASGVAMAADRMPNERISNSNMPGCNQNPYPRSGRGCGHGRNWNQEHNGRGFRRKDHWEPNQGTWVPNRASQPRDRQYEAITSSPKTLSNGCPPLLPTPQGNSSNAHSLFHSNTQRSATHHMTTNATSLPNAQPYTVD